MATMRDVVNVGFGIAADTKKSASMSKVNVALNKLERFGSKLITTSDLNPEEEDILGAILNNYVSPVIERARQDFKRGKLDRR